MNISGPAFHSATLVFQQRFLRKVLLSSVALFLSGCVTNIPIDEYALARAALEAAKEAEAPRYAPALWYKAETAYREGEALYKDRHYDESEDRFLTSRQMAEQAENVARVTRFESGDVAP